MRRICTYLGVLLVSCLAASVVRADLVAHYAAEGDANDQTTNHNGTLVNGTGFGAGKFGQAFDLNGTNQYVSALDSADWAFGAGSFTISLYANFDTIRVGSVGSLPNVFVAHDDGGGTQLKWIFLYDGSGNLAFHVNTIGNSEFMSPPTTFTPTASTWHLYTVTRDGNTYTFYADGISLGTATGTLAVPNASVVLTIGQAESLGFVDGRLDDVRIYNHALAATEVQALLVPEPAAALSLTLMAFCLASARRRPVPF